MLFGVTYCEITTVNPSRSSGKERDGETGLDYFGARYYGSNMGRWLSPDWAERANPVPYADFGDPQSLNLYAYVRNRPVFTKDLDGHQDNVWKDFLNVIEIEVDAGIGVKANARFGTTQINVQALRAGAEFKTGLGGGNAEGKVVGKIFEAKLKSGPVEGSLKAGVEASSKDGAKTTVGAEGKVGPAQGSVSIDQSGKVSTTGTLAADQDTKVGLNVQAIVGVGVQINFSQLGRALENGRTSFQQLGQAIVQEMQKHVPDRELPH